MEILLSKMYDYNFEESLTQERLTLLLLSLVIPTDTLILQNIYKKKKELEIMDIHLEIKILKMTTLDTAWLQYLVYSSHCFVLRQIRCLHPRFILYESDEGEERYPITVEVNPIKKLSLVDWFSAEGAGLDDPLEIELFTKKLENRFSPRGINIVNRIFKEYTENYNITHPHHGIDTNEAPIWNSSADLDYTINGYQHIDETLDSRQQAFNHMDISGQLEHLLYDSSEGNSGAIVVKEWNHTIDF